MGVVLAHVIELLLHYISHCHVVPRLNSSCSLTVINQGNLSKEGTWSEDPALCIFLKLILHNNLTLSFRKEEQLVSYLSLIDDVLLWHVEGGGQLSCNKLNEGFLIPKYLIVNDNLGKDMFGYLNLEGR